MMSEMLKNQVAIVTGSARGIGREVAQMFADHGAKVVITDKDEAPVAEAVTAIREAGGDAISFCGDVTAPDFAKNIIDTTIKNFGRLDILVNNAGYTADNLVHRLTDEQFQEMLDIHLIAPFRLIREATPYMRDAAKKEIENGVTNYRKIVNVSSMSGVKGNVGQANYSAAKAGVLGLTKTIALEWGQFNINCNSVAFGFIDTRLTRPKEEGGSVNGAQVGIPTKVRDAIINKIPQRRAGEAKEAASAIFYLASPLSNYINGQVHLVNGGSYS